MTAIRLATNKAVATPSHGISYAEVVVIYKSIPSANNIVS